MRYDGELARRLPTTKRNAFLDPAAAWRLVETVKPGLMAAASMEKYRDGWRLRITLNRPNGRVVRRSVVIPGDGTTANWGGAGLAQANAEWREQRAGHEHGRASVPTGM